MDRIDILGWIAYALIGIGFVLIGKRERMGWALKLMGDALWCALGWHMGMSSIMIPEGISAAASLYFWWEWRNETTKC